MPFFAFLSKDARLVLRNRALLLALLAYPFLLALVLGAAFQEPPQTLDLAIVDRDRSNATIDVGGTPVGVADLLASAEPFADLRRPATEDAALRLLRQGDVDAVLVIPPNFMRDLSQLGVNTSLRLIVDESDPIRAAVAQSAVEGAVERFVAQIVEKKIQDVVQLLGYTVEGGTTRGIRVLGIDAALVKLDEVKATLPPGGPEAAKLDEVAAFLGFARLFLGDSERYLTTTAIPLSLASEGLTTSRASVASVALPGALILGVFWTGALAAALLAARERETGADRRLAAAPHAHASALASKALVALTAALVPAGVVLAFGITLLGASVADPGLAFLALALAALAAASLGAFAAALAKNTGGAALLAVLVLVPMLLLGGLFYPISYMPAPAQAVASVLPVTLATEALRGAMLRGSNVFELALPLAGLALAALILTGATWAARRRVA